MSTGKNEVCLKVIEMHSKILTIFCFNGFLMSIVAMMTFVNVEKKIKRNNNSDEENIHKELKKVINSVIVEMFVKIHKKMKEKETKEHLFPDSNFKFRRQSFLCLYFKVIIFFLFICNKFLNYDK